MLILRAYKFSYLFSLKYTKRHENSIYFCFTSILLTFGITDSPQQPTDDRYCNVPRNVRTSTFLYATKCR